MKDNSRPSWWGRRIKSRYFDGTPVRLDWDKVQEVDGRTLVLGAKAGPERSSKNLIHEMSHLVEIDDGRILEPGWGLRLPYYLLMGRWVNEPNTTQATERELRVFAYQYNVLDHLGMRFHNEVDALVHMPDFPLVVERESEPKDSYPDRRLAAVHWFRSEVDRLRNVYTYGRFEKEWARKVQLLAEIKEVEK